MAGIRQKEPEVQKVVIRRKDLRTRLKGAGAKEAAAAVPGTSPEGVGAKEVEAAAVPGTRQMVVDGTVTRAGMPAVVVAGGKLVPELAAPDLWACI